MAKKTSMPITDFVFRIRNPKSKDIWFEKRYFYAEFVLVSQEERTWKHEEDHTMYFTFEDDEVELLACSWIEENKLFLQSLGFTESKIAEKIEALRMEVFQTWEDSKPPPLDTHTILSPGGLGKTRNGGGYF